MERIRLEGKAENGKAGALLLTDSGAVWYIQSLPGWPDDILHCRIEVTGIPTSVFHSEQDLRDETGAYRQGMSGEQRILTQASWVRLDTH